MKIKTTLDIAKNCGDYNEGIKWVALDDLIKYLKESCYCRSGEGTFIGSNKKDFGVCVFCHIKQKVKKR